MLIKYVKVYCYIERCMNVFNFVSKQSKECEKINAGLYEIPKLD